MPKFQGDKGGGKGGGKKSKGAEISPDSVKSKSIAKLMDIYSEGETGGLIEGPNGSVLESVFVIEGSTITPVMASDGTLNIQGVSVIEVFGTPDQTAVSGFSAVEYEVIVDLEATNASPVTRSIIDEDLDAIRLKVRWSSMSTVDSSGDVRPTWADFRIDVQPDGGSFTEVISERFAAKTESPYEREYRIELPAGGAPWTIRLRRIEPDSTLKRNSDMFWASYTGIIDAKLKYPNTAAVFVTVDAQQFAGDNVPGRGYLVRGIKIEVPTNYDPITRVYATTGPGTTGGIWDGTFKRAVCGNPAWVLRDMVTNKRYGCGDEVDEAQVDKWTLYEIAQYCDELIDDGTGTGGQIARYEINTQINSQETAFAVLQAIASAFRGYTYWGAGELPLTAGQDRPQDPVKIFTPANILGGTFNREGTDVLARHTAALVSWNDPNDAYRQAVELVTDDEGLQELGWRPIQVTAFGCNNQMRAHLLGKWILDTERYESETITFAVGLADADVAPGQVVLVADPVTAGVREGGRIAAGTSTSLTIDQEVNLLPGEDYVLTFVLEDGTLSDDIPLNNAAGSTSVLTWDTPIVAPVPNHMWVLSSGAIEPQPYRVIKITETEKHNFEITALVHDPNKYARVERDIILQPASYSLLPTGPLAAPQSLTARGYIYQNGAVPLVAGLYSWTPAADPRVMRYEINISLPPDPEEDELPTDDVPYTIFDTVSDVSYTVNDVPPGYTTFRVRSMDGAGRKSAWATAEIRIAPLSERPADVGNFRVSVLGDTATLRWDTGIEYDISYWRIKFAPVTSGASWESSGDLEPSVTGNSFQVPAMVGTYLIKAYDILGNDSQNAATVVNLAGGLNYFNVVETIDEAPAFSGAKNDVVYDAGLSGLTLDGAAVSGTYNFATDIDLGAVFTSRVSLAMTAGGINTATDLFSVADIFALEDIFMSGAGSWTVDVQMRRTPDDPSVGPTWTDWESLIIGDYSFRAAQFRVVLTSLAEGVTPLITALAVGIDMPDRPEGGLNISVPDTGLTIAFSPPMESLKALSVTITDGATGDYVEIASQDENGFTLFVRDSSAAAIGTRHINYAAEGWGFAN